jgi:hypothetical protein
VPHIVSETSIKEDAMKPRLLTHDGKTMSVVDWARELKITPRAMYNRVLANVTPDKMFLAEQAPRERQKHDLALFQRYLQYEPETGRFLRDGAEVVIKNRGNSRISVPGGRARAMALAWAFQAGKWPTGNVYPIDGDALNLRFANLRLRDEDRYDGDGKISAKTRHGYGLVRRYGRNSADYDRMFKAQNGLCAICGKPEKQRGRTGRVKPLQVDHDHVTGGVRELLCAHCNWLIGLAEEDPNVLRLGAEYLLRHKRKKYSVITRE